MDTYTYSTEEKAILTVDEALLKSISLHLKKYFKKIEYELESSDDEEIKSSEIARIISFKNTKNNQITRIRILASDIKMAKKTQYTYSRAEIVFTRPRWRGGSTLKIEGLYQITKSNSY